MVSNSVDSLHAGDIGAVTKLAMAQTGDTLSQKQRVLTLRGPRFPTPLYSVAITPVTKADTAKMGQTLTRLCEEDPTFQWRQDPSTVETILSGMGDAHVDAAVRRMKKSFQRGARGPHAQGSLQGDGNGIRYGAVPPQEAIRWCWPIRRGPHAG